MARWQIATSAASFWSSPPSWKRSGPGAEAGPPEALLDEQADDRRHGEADQPHHELAPAEQRKTQGGSVLTQNGHGPQG
eukprot:7979544-Heterocapsa_arctica.AAC.1